MPDRSAASRLHQLPLKLAALVLLVATVGLPVNQLDVYALLVVLAVVIFIGDISTRPRAWIAATVLVAMAIGGQILLAPPRIEEGHNVFLPGAPGNVFERGLAGRCLSSPGE